MKKLLEKLAPLVASFGLMLAIATPATVLAQNTPSITDGLNKGTCLNTNSDNCEVGDGEEAVNNIITTVINIFSIVVGVVAVIMIIIGGLKYITSGGDSGNVSGAKNTILYAIVGLVIVALAQIIVRFVLNRVSNPTGV